MKPRFVELAKKAARCSTHQFRVGAVVTHRNQVISFGYNKPTKTHPKSRNRWGRIHAELDAILGVPLDVLRGANVYVVRLTRSGLLATSRPCVDCLAYLRDVGIRKMFFVDEKRIVREENVRGESHQYH